jgi:hypothetical protein
MPTNSGLGALVKHMTAAATSTLLGRVALLGYVAGAPDTSSWALIGLFILPWLAAHVVPMTTLSPSPISASSR